MSDHYSELELTFSRIALDLKIDNTPSIEVKRQLLFTMAGLERLRACLGFPIKVLSGYRSEALNTAVKGSKNSQHMRGEAVDITCPAFGAPKEVATRLSGLMGLLGIDQLILEGTWVHVSFTLLPRKQCLTLDQTSGKYLKGIV